MHEIFSRTNNSFEYEKENQMFKKHERKKANIIQLCFPTQILRWFSRGSEKTSINVPIDINS